MSLAPSALPPMNTAPAGAFERDMPAGFAAFYRPLHERFTRRQQELANARREVLAASLDGKRPTYLAASAATTQDWKIDLPDWCQDQRNQMTGPADEAELVVKMLNSGAPGVMLDLEDSMANEWEHTLLGVRNIIAALYGELTYDDKKRGVAVGIKESPTVTFTRVRGLHLNQAKVYDELTSASLFDLALLVYELDVSRLKHPLCIYIPKSESATEALWWRDVLQTLAEQKGQPKDYIKCMALCEAHPLAYQLEEFAYNLREHLIGLNLGRWDYMASLIHFNFNDPAWVLPDRNTIPHDVAFFQNLRTLIPSICHKHGMLAIGGMTALYPSREDPELNERALKALAQDKKNEATCLMDGAWTGHPRSERDRGRTVSGTEPVGFVQSRLRGAARSATFHRGRRSEDDRGHARGSADGDPVSQRIPQWEGCESTRRLHGRSRDRPHLSVDDRPARQAWHAQRSRRDAALR